MAWKAILVSVSKDGAGVRFEHTDGSVRDELYPLSEFNTALQFRNFVKKILDAMNADDTKASDLQTTLSQYIGKEVT